LLIGPVSSDKPRGKFNRPIKKQVTLRLDADLIEWFKVRLGSRTSPARIHLPLRQLSGFRESETGIVKVF
jgi:uncharacterized protein (DUF4415 family)